MKLNNNAMANSFGVAGAIFYLGCYLIALFLPDLYKSVAQSWFHMADLSSIWKSAPSNLFLGFVSFVTIAWFTGWILAFTYNSFNKK